MPEPKGCVPAEPGYYWATHRNYNNRQIIKVSKDGFGHVRAFTFRGPHSHDPMAFTDYSEAIVETPAEPTREENEEN